MIELPVTKVLEYTTKELAHLLRDEPRIAGVDTFATYLSKEYPGENFFTVPHMQKDVYLVVFHKPYYSIVDRDGKCSIIVRD